MSADTIATAITSGVMFAAGATFGYFYLRRKVISAEFKARQSDRGRVAENELRKLVEGQLAAANREIAMMRKARSDASRKGAVTKRAKRIQLPGVGL